MTLRCDLIIRDATIIDGTGSVSVDSTPVVAGLLASERTSG